MEPFEDLDTAIERRRQMRIRRRRRLYLRRALLLTVCAAIVALLIATPIWIVNGIRSRRDRGADSQTDAHPTATQTTATVPQKPPIPAVDASTAWLGSAVQSEYAVLLDMTEGRVVAAKNPHVQANPASITKVMTLLVAVENIADLDAEYVMPYQVTNYVYTLDPDASVTGFGSGDKMTLRDLLYGCILPSGADAAVALAHYVVGDRAATIAQAEELFAQMMNERAAELGAQNTNFINTHGLHGTQHKTTAMDMALMMAAAMENETCRAVLMADRYSSPATKRLPVERLAGGEWCSTLFNSWLGSNRYGIMAGKTGYTDQALHTLATYTVGADGHEYVLVSMFVNGRDNAVSDARHIYETYCR